MGLKNMRRYFIAHTLYITLAQIPLSTPENYFPFICNLFDIIEHWTHIGANARMKDNATMPRAAVDDFPDRTQFLLRSYRCMTSTNCYCCNIDCNMNSLGEWERKKGEVARKSKNRKTRKSSWRIQCGDNLCECLSIFASISYSKVIKPEQGLMHTMIDRARWGN